MYSILMLNILLNVYLTYQLPYAIIQIFYILQRISASIFQILYKPRVSPTYY